MDDDLNPAFADPVSEERTSKGNLKKYKIPKYTLLLFIVCMIVLVGFTLIYKLLN